MPVPLDEYPIHQSPVSVRHMATSDRNAYDRCYFNVTNRTDEMFMATGLGIYPNLGVIDAYASIRMGDRQHSVRFSDASTDDRMSQQVGGYRIEVIEPLKRIRLICEPPSGSSAPKFDLTWDGSFDVVEEEHHTMRQGPKTILEACRFAQVGTWEGHLEAGGRSWEVTPDTWLGSRDRSWGIRPVGEAEPPGRTAAEMGDGFGFYWTYLPLRFDDFAIVVIAQEDATGHRTLNNAVRVHTDGTVEQLGWPRIDIRYRSGSRSPEGASVHLTKRDGTPVTLEVEPLTAIILGLGSGYGQDPTWTHGSWKGREWSDAIDMDVNSPEAEFATAFSVVDHASRVTWSSAGDQFDGAVGYGLFEHQIIGAHAPTGFTDFGSVAP